MYSKRFAKRHKYPKREFIEKRDAEMEIRTNVFRSGFDLIFH